MTQVPEIMLTYTQASFTEFARKNEINYPFNWFGWQLFRPVQIFIQPLHSIAAKLYITGLLNHIFAQGKTLYREFYESETIATRKSQLLLFHKTKAKWEFFAHLIAPLTYEECALFKIISLKEIGWEFFSHWNSHRFFHLYAY